MIRPTLFGADIFALGIASWHAGCATEGPEFAPKAGSFGAAWGLNNRADFYRAERAACKLSKIMKSSVSSRLKPANSGPSVAQQPRSRNSTVLAGTYCQLRESLLDGERLQIVPTGTLDHFHRNRGPLRAGISGPLRPEYAGVSPGSRNVPKAGSISGRLGPSHAVALVCRFQMRTAALVHLGCRQYVPARKESARLSCGNRVRWFGAVLLSGPLRDGRQAAPNDPAFGRRSERILSRRLLSQRSGCGL